MIAIALFAVASDMWQTMYYFERRNENEEGIYCSRGYG